MGAKKSIRDEEAEPLTGRNASRASIDSTSTASISLAFVDRANGSAPHERPRNTQNEKYYDDDERDPEEGKYALPPAGKSGSKFRIIFGVVVGLCVGGWVLALFLFLASGKENVADKTVVNSPEGMTPDVLSSGSKKITLDNVLGGSWRPRGHEISWFPGPDGEDGLLLERDDRSKGAYLRVEDIRNRKARGEGKEAITLMKESSFKVGKGYVSPSRVWPSPNLKYVLVMSDETKNWRHSYTGKYWLFNVDTQTGEPLDHEAPDQEIQLASWSHTSDAVVFTRKNNMFIRRLDSKAVKPITTDGGVNLFYGVPDWVYEEEVFSGNSATWWANDGQYVAFLRTNESQVPEFPIQYFLSRPTGKKPRPGEEDYPDVRKIKYPKAGAPNPVVELQFYDVKKGEVFSVDVDDDLPDHDRIIIEVVWASGGKVIVRETNRESDVLKVILIDTHSRTGKVVRSEDVKKLDGGWVEPSQSTQFIPADPENGRPDDGYIDTVVHDGYNHLAYFTPLDKSDPVFLTTGSWEVVDAPSAVDLKKGLVYFVAAKESPIERHVYTVKLDGTDMKPITESGETAYYAISLSAGAGYALLKYEGPGVPWQKVISTPANEVKYEETIEKNGHLSRKLKKYALPTLVYQNITIDGYTLPVVEQRPPNFDSNKSYPVLFHLYGGPGSQTVSRKFHVDFQTYVAANLGYLVVTVDGRGTGFIGRKARCIIRDHLGHHEAIDQIETAKAWGKKPYVDEKRMAIWGWSYGGFMTLKTLERDAGRTFQYGMAVAPVTDWRYYDSIYTERYMHTPQNNPDGYAQTAVSNMTALQNTERFLVIHGSADDNVHTQNTLTLLDKLDNDGVRNFDVHFFPDSDHSIYFHNAYHMVHQRLSDWLVNAFNGEWAKIRNPTPKDSLVRRAIKFFSRSEVLMLSKPPERLA